jgi:RHS repeat-associated protein
LSSSTAPKVGLAGQYADPETGLQYVRARYYDPGTGNMLSRDPAVSSTRDPYGYAGRSPLNATDPSGLYWGEDQVDAVGGAISGAADKIGSVASDAWARWQTTRYNVCIGGGIVVNVGYCENFDGFSPAGGEERVGVGLGAGASAVVSGGSYSQGSLEGCLFIGGGGCIGKDNHGNRTFSAGIGFGGWGGNASGTPAFICDQAPGLCKAAKKACDVLNGDGSDSLGFLDPRNWLASL